MSASKGSLAQVRSARPSDGSPASLPRLGLASSVSSPNVHRAGKMGAPFSTSPQGYLRSPNGFGKGGFKSPVAYAARGSDHQTPSHQNSVSKLQRFNVIAAAAGKQLKNAGTLVDSIDQLAESMKAKFAMGGAPLPLAPYPASPPPDAWQVQLQALQDSFEKRIAALTMDLNAERAARSAVEERLRVLEDGTAASSQAPETEKGVAEHRIRALEEVTAGPIEERLQALEEAAAITPFGALHSLSFRARRLSSTEAPAADQTLSVSPTPERDAATQHGAPMHSEEDGRLILAKEMGEADDVARAGSFCADKTIIASFSCHGIEPKQGGHSVGKINQDCACIAHPVGGNEQAALFCVYDGHGVCGEHVSRAVLREVHGHLVDHPSLHAAPSATLTSIFEAVQGQLMVWAEEDPMRVDATESGACAVVASLCKRDLWVAGAGDCRAVIGTAGRDGAVSAVCLSTDHKCDLSSEQKRIEAAGGYVRPATSEGDAYVAPARLFEQQDNQRLGPGLAISRAIGDLNAMCCGLVATPDIFHHSVNSDDRFLILASDGVWEFISAQEAVEFVNGYFSRGRSAVEACQMLIARAAAAWRNHEGDYRDDITAIVVWLPAVVAELEKRSSK
jgi:protein phosphatase 2C family protein 2/3